MPIAQMQARGCKTGVHGQHAKHPVRDPEAVRKGLTKGHIAPAFPINQGVFGICPVHGFGKIGAVGKVLSVKLRVATGQKNRIGMGVWAFVFQRRKE